MTSTTPRDPFAGNGTPAAEVLAGLGRLRADDVDLDRVTAYHFESHVDGLRELVAAAAAGAFGVNGLNPIAFPSVARIENDLVAATAAWHGGGAETVGTVTSGGTESCLLAVLGARQRWREANGTSGSAGENRPTIVLQPPVVAARPNAVSPPTTSPLANRSKLAPCGRTPSTPGIATPPGRSRAPGPSPRCSPSPCRCT